MDDISIQTNLRPPNRKTIRVSNPYIANNSYPQPTPRANMNLGKNCHNEEKRGHTYPGGQHEPPGIRSKLFLKQKQSYHKTISKRKLSAMHPLN